MAWLKPSNRTPAGYDPGTPLWPQTSPTFLPAMPLAPADPGPMAEGSIAAATRDAFEKSDLVYACIQERATSLPEAPLRVFSADGKGEPRDEHPLRRLIENPNPAFSEYELWELTVAHLDLIGNAFWEVVVDRVGIPRELWPLRPDRVVLLRFAGGQYDWGYMLDTASIVPLQGNVIHFKYPSPLDPFYGTPPLRPAARAVQLDNLTTDFVSDLMRNRAIPGIVLKTQNVLDQATETRLKAQWRAAFQTRTGRGGVAVLPRGMEADVLGLNPSDLEFPELRSVAESRICAAFGVPPILVGAKVGLDRSTFSNYGEARKSFWEETLIPLQRRLRAPIVRDLLPRLQGQRPRRVEVRFDNANVAALRESEESRWTRATEALRAGGVTVNDYRRTIGLPEVPGGDVFLMPAGVIPVAPEQLPDVAPDLAASSSVADSTTNESSGAADALDQNARGEM